MEHSESGYREMFSTHVLWSTDVIIKLHFV